ncbi:MAG: HNH endonuclease signature motif containing protein [Frankiaceae bacterium]
MRDRGCAFPGCDRPARWTQAHHIEHWSDGGATATDNCVLLCAAHHRAVHHSGWRVRIEPDHLPSFYPPAWIDPEQRARRNMRLLTAQRHFRERITPRIAPRPIATITPILRT